ncbi:MAG: hypothetical protein ACRBF0_25505 [Calditrichia bacterium]
MKGTRYMQLSKELISMLGFAKKSGALVAGFEAVRRAATQGKLGFVLIDDSLAQNSRKKVLSLVERNEIPLLVAKATEDEFRVEFVTGYKILGMQSGSLAKGFAVKLKQEHQWR